MRVRRTAAALLFGCAVATGTWLDRLTDIPSAGGQVLVADLHVHPYPGDGALTLRQLQREAARRGVDVLAATGHNHQAALRLAAIAGTDPEGAIILPAQELTAPGFHLAAVGVDRLIDWRLPAADAIEAIHRQGGVAIAAHPTKEFRDGLPDEALRRLDGAEVAHPLALARPERRAELDAFFARARTMNPNLAPIGSTDFHMTAPLGRCRTYLLVQERSATGVLDAIRSGRTVAADDEGRLFGDPEHVARVEQHLARRPAPPGVTAWERLAAFAALVALGLGIVPSAADSRMRIDIAT